MNESATRLYEYFKTKWENTKPIRGRAEDVRPIGKRRRDWEKITRKDLGNGEYSYCAVLYGTECVEYFPNGDVQVQYGGWGTPLTAEFIHVHSPFTCFKQNRKLWLRVKEGTGGDVKVYPLGAEGLRFKWVQNYDYEPIEPVVIKKRVVNRTKAKEARVTIMPFINWAKTILTLSDGWVMHETKKQVFGWKDNNYAMHPITNDERMLEMVESGDDEQYLKALCLMTHRLHEEASRTAEQFQEPYEFNGRTYQHTRVFHDYQMKMETIKRHVYKLVENGCDVHDVVEVKPTDKTMTNVI